MTLRSFYWRSWRAGGLRKYVQRPPARPVIARYRDNGQRYLFIRHEGPGGMVQFAWGNRHVGFEAAEVSHETFMQTIQGIPGKASVAEFIHALQPYINPQPVSFADACRKVGISVYEVRFTK